MKVIYVFCWFLFFFDSRLFGWSESGKNFLERFHENPLAVSGESPEKLTISGRGLDLPAVKWEDRDAVRVRILQNGRIKSSGNRLNGSVESSESKVGGPIASNDDPALLVDGGLKYRTLEEIEQAQLTSGKLARSPWSDDYWPIYKGILGVRYADSNFPATYEWPLNYEYIVDHTAEEVALAGDQDLVDSLSPSEKYELVLGLSSGPLTRKMWQEGKYYYDRYGEVESWFGICHGWAPASFMLDRPQGKVVLPAKDYSFDVTFYPSDIKGLSSLLWAKTSVPAKFIGGRCYDKAPEVDPDSGRVVSDGCFDTNPATWHLSLIHQIGLAKRSMVMDASFDYEVWNQPVYSYAFHYFNPETLEESDDYLNSRVSLEDYSRDKFAKFRSAEAEAVVGVIMEVEYMVETSPSQRAYDDESYDGRRLVRYVYDLELDGEGKIIGGEWYQRAHPDFLWTPVKGSRARTIDDRLIVSKWDGKSPLPEEWTQGADRSARKGLPLGKVVELLIELARGSE